MNLMSLAYWPTGLRLWSRVLKTCLKSTYSKRACLTWVQKRFQRKWKINECKRQRAWRGGQRGVGRVPGRQLTVGPFGPLTAAASIFLFASRGWHRAQAESLTTNTIDHAIFFPVLCRGHYYHRDHWTINHSHPPHPIPEKSTPVISAKFIISSWETSSKEREHSVL